MKPWLILSLASIVTPGLVQAVEFPVKKISVGGKTLSVEIAENDESRQQGLMNRKNLDDGKGMLFIFTNETPQSFWMKNTYIALSIAFFDSKKKLVDLFDMEPEVSDSFGFNPYRVRLEL
jgi:uncharacterized membrane protein (UPF0127 family)